MAITVECTCGERMKVRDEAARKNIKCRKCGNILTVPATPDPPPGPSLIFKDAPSEPAPAKGPSSAPSPTNIAEPRAAVRIGRRVPPWEIWIVLGLVGISLLSSVIKLAQRPGGIFGIEMSVSLYVGFGVAALSVIMLLSILGRTAQGLWFGIVPGSLGAIGCFVMPSFLPTSSAAEEPETFLTLAALLWIGAIVFLIVCKVRGAYDRWCAS